MIYDTIVIGAGQAGLAIGYQLRGAGLRFVLLEAGDEPGGSWPNFYDSLFLNSTAHYSSLPGLPFPGQPDHYPRRDEATAYLRGYAAHFRLPIVTGTRVLQVEHSGGHFHLTTSRGEYEARTVVAATGLFGQPYLPNLPGQAQYKGQLLHAADYQNSEPFHQQRIVIVGGGNAAVQIGVELAQVAQVTLATHRPIRYLPQRVLRQDVHFWLNLTGLDHTQWLGDLSTPVYDTGQYRAAITRGQPDRRPMFRHFTENGVIWSDGCHETIDTVIFATGYRPNLAYLTGLGVLDEAGRALQRGGVSTSMPGLYFVGLPRQRNVASATLRGVGADAKAVVTHLWRYSQAQLKANDKSAPGLKVITPGHTWVSRGNEFLGLIMLITLALRQQLVTRRFAAPRLVGNALIQSFKVSAGFLGFGHAAILYSQI